MQLNRRTLIILISVLGVGMITLAILGFMRAGQKNGTAEQGYTDPGSGEVIRGDDKSQQGTDLTIEKTTVWLGFSTLLQRGLTASQITDVQTVITKYGDQQAERFKEVSIDTKSYRHIIPEDINDTSSTITFDLTANRTQKYYVEVKILDTKTVHTKLFKDDKTTLLVEG